MNIDYNVWFRVCDRLQSEFWNQIQRNPTWNHHRNQLWEQVWSHSYNQIRDQVQSKVEDQMRSELN